MANALESSLAAQLNFSNSLYASTGSDSRMNNWALVTSGKYAEAVVAFTEEIRASPATGAFNNRGKAYLHLGEYAAALADFQAAEAFSESVTHDKSDGDMRGVALWMAGRWQAALETWIAGVQLRLNGEVLYGDMAGGLTIGNLLYFGGIRLHDKRAIKLATKHFRKRFRTKQSRAWPGPISRYLLGMISEADLLSVVTPAPILHERYMCQARFYLGVHALSQGENAQFATAIRAAVEFGEVSKLEEEYYMALHELQSIDSSK